MNRNSLMARSAVALALGVAAAAPARAGDAQAGQGVFATQCASCHTVKPGQHGFGLSLALGGGVITYEIGGNEYVAAMSGVVSGFFGGSGTSSVVVFGLAPAAH
jgi:mono/diheme cytochrome c family protein